MFQVAGNRTRKNIHTPLSTSLFVFLGKRVEDEYVNWESRNRHAKEDDPTAEGYFDPIIDMGRLFFERRPLPYKGPFHPKYEDVYFDTYAAGRLLGCRTNWWAYHLDPETGIATCTGAQVK